MDESGYRPDQSFANSFAAYSFDQIPLSIHALIEYLSLCLSPDDIVDLSRQLRRFSDADLYSLATSFRRRSIALSDDQRSSYISTFSRRSIQSNLSAFSSGSAATDYGPIQQPGVEPENQWTKLYPGSSAGVQLPTQPQASRPSHSALHNQDSSYPTHGLPVLKPFCFACNEEFETKGSLTRHRKEQCEREEISACSLCPLPRPIYYTQRGLIRHHVSTHGDKCPNGCSKKENVITSPCKELLSASFARLPAKKAWGCPYCIKCFKSFEEWNRHCNDHRRKFDKTTPWLFANMIWSLCQQNQLREALSRHDCPSAGDWARVNEKTCSGFREVLEHCKLPQRLRAREYWYLDDCDAVVRFVFDTIRTGQSFPSQQLFEINDEITSQQIPFTAVQTSRSEPCIPESASLQAVNRERFPPLTYTDDRLEGAEVAHKSVNGVDLVQSQPQHNLVLDLPGDGRHGTASAQNQDRGSGSQTRRRAASLKRTFSNLSLRASSSKSSLAQAEEVPPMPAVPNDLRLSNANKVEPGAHQDVDGLASSYLDPITPSQFRMSGVIHGSVWPDDKQS